MSRRILIAWPPHKSISCRWSPYSLQKARSHGRRMASQRSMPRIPVAEPSVQLSPETRRRIMQEIEINVRPNTSYTVYMYTNYTHIYFMYTHVMYIHVCVCVQVQPPKDSSQKKEVFSFQVCTCTCTCIYMAVCLECTGTLLVLCINLIQ